MCRIRFHILRDYKELDNFVCGIDVMDDFLHSDRLKESIIANHCDPYIIEDDKNNVIGFFALDITTLELDDDYKADLMQGMLDAAKPEFQTKEELRDFLERKVFDVVDIAYLAIHKDYQHKGVGSEVMSIIFDIARIKMPESVFITVDALYLKDRGYNTAPFYEKFGFQRMYPVFGDTIRMFSTIYPYKAV